MSGDAPDILIVPFEFRDRRLLKELESRLSKVFAPLQVKAMPRSRLPLPFEGYGSRREQHLTTHLIEALEALSAPAIRILGVANVDLFAPGSLHVLGQARIPGRSAVISVTRLRQEYYNLRGDRQLLLARARKMAIYELGRTFGLFNCSAPRCAMGFSLTVKDLDLKNDRLCRQCSADLKEVAKKTRRTRTTRVATRALVLG